MHENFISARQLHTDLGVGWQFSKWIKPKLDVYREGIDYVISQVVMHHKRLIDYRLTPIMAKAITVQSRSDIAQELKRNTAAGELRALRDEIKELRQEVALSRLGPSRDSTQKTFVNMEVCEKLAGIVEYSPNRRDTLASMDLVARMGHSAVDISKAVKHLFPEVLHSRSIRFGQSVRAGYRNIRFLT